MEKQILKVSKFSTKKQYLYKDVRKRQIFKNSQVKLAP